jgi:hypothetical protein
VSFLTGKYLTRFISEDGEEAEDAMSYKKPNHAEERRPSLWSQVYAENNREGNML